MVLSSVPDSWDSDPDELMKLEIPIFPWNNCSKIAENYTTNLTNQICAGTLEGGKYPCNVTYIYFFIKINIHL